MGSNTLREYMKLVTLLTFIPFCVSSIENDLDFSIPAIKDEYIVRLSSRDTEAFYQAASSVSPSFEAIDSTYVGDDPVVLIREEQDIADANVFERLRQEFGNDIDYVTNNFKITLTVDEKEGKDQTHTQPADGYRWGLNRISNRDIPVNVRDKVYRWSDNDDGTGVTVYVLDSGVFEKHDEFADISVSWGFSVEDKTSNRNKDVWGHGTHVAGIIAGKTCGVAKNASIVAVGVIHSMTEGDDVFSTLKGLHFINEDFKSKTQNGSRSRKVIVNMSISLPVPDNIDIFEKALEEGAQAGIIYVAAAGNVGNDSCLYWPARSKYTLTVAALNQTDGVADFSNYGNCVDLLAPGVNILSAGIAKRDDTVVDSGTSMAAPFVSGVIARYLSNTENPYDLDSVLEHLINTATKDKAVISPQKSVPNRILYAGVNTAFKGTESSSKTTIDVVDSGTSMVAPLCVLQFAYFCYLL